MARNLWGVADLQERGPAAVSKRLRRWHSELLAMAEWLDAYASGKLNGTPGRAFTEIAAQVSMASPAIESAIRACPKRPPQNATVTKVPASERAAEEED